MSDPRPRAEPDSHACRVLCIEDDSDILRVLRLSLARLGAMKVHVCMNPRDALATAHEVMPDIILLDYKMPGLDGLDVLRGLQADPQLHRIPVIFLTASATVGEVERLQQAGAAGVLLKPFEPAKLAAQITQLWLRTAIPPETA